MLSMYLRVLRTLANTGQLKGSIDNATENVKDILKDIEGTSVTHPAPFEVYSPTYQEARKAEYTGGKAGIGPFALNNAHHILTQLTKLKMASNPFTEAMQITDLSRMFDIPTDTDPRGGRILDWLSAMINAFVDIAKDPYIVRLNVNGWTYNMVSFLLRAGKGKQTFYFMYQPILREMAQEVLKTKGKYGVDRTKTPSQLEQEAIQRVLDKYDKDGKFQKKYRQINQDDELSATTYSSLFKTFINDKGEESSALREMLKDPEYVGDSNEAQVMIYYAWLKLKPYADSLANLVKYSKIDTKKIGKSFAEQQNYYDGMMRMLDDPNFAEGEIRKFYDETFVGHKTENAIPFGISIFKNLLLRNTQLFTDQKNVILSLLGRRGIADSGLINATIKGMEAQTKAQFFNDYIKSNSIDLQGMFKGQMSMAKRLNNFKQLILRRDPRMSHLIDNTGHITNDFIEFLLPNIQNTEDRPNELDFIDTSDLLNVDQAKANNLINYWRELIEDPNPQISKLFKDLVVYAFITTGDNPTMNSFFQYVPNSYRIQMGYRDFMRGQLDKFSNESTASYPDKDDFFRNNWYNDKLVKPVELTNSRGNGLLGIYYNNHMPNIVMGARLGNRGLQQAIKPINWITNVADGKKYPVFAPYIKISDSRFNRPENWHLYTLIGYKYDGDSKKYIPIYGLISKKGYKYRGHTVTEYGVQTQFDFNIEPEWNYVEAVNNPTQIADMAESAFAGMGTFWEDIKPISSLVTYQNSNYLHSMIDTVVEEDTQADNVPLEEKDEPAEVSQPSTSNQTMNIYFGTNENADLSNLAIRPFTHLGIQFQSVEQAFQFYKTEFSPKDEYNHAVGQAIMTTTKGSDLRRLGRQYRGLSTKEWDAMAPTIMKQLIKDSFEQNPDALQRLLSTGNTTLTHIQDRGRWGIEFPRILMEVREELRQQNAVSLQNQDNNSNIAQEWSSKEGWSVEYFNSKVLPRINEAWQIEYQLAPDQNVNAKLRGSMNFSYGNNAAPNIQSKTTLEAIKNGERTATTRYESDGHIDYWRQAKVGDVIEFYNKSGESVKVIVTKPLTKLVQQQGIKQQNNINDYVLHSGGALGADSMWGQIAEEYGIPNTPDRQMHYYNNQPTPRGNVQISQEDYEEGRYKVAEAAKANWGYQYKTMKDDRLIRNWSQVKHSDAIYAIGTIVKEGERIFPNQPGDTRTAKHTAVTGGTGYAVEMAIQAGKPVYVFDQSRNRWFKNINGEWSVSEVPTLTPNFAGIGTRQIQQNGINAIRAVFENTFNSNQQDNQQTIQSMDELVTTDLSAVDYMVKYDRAVKQLNTVLDQMELTSDERNQYYLDFNDFLQRENEAGNLQNNEQIEGVVNKFICNL